MQFFFAENCDWVDPRFDFEADLHAPGRQPHRDDHYPHEYFEKPPYDGLLVSRSIVGGPPFSGKYTQTQRYRFLREGAHCFLRFPYADFEGDRRKFPIMGDCGAFSYIRARMPTVSNAEMVDYYIQCGFTHAVSVDHIIVGHNTAWDDRRRLPSNIETRAEFTAASAVEFLSLCREQKAGFVPVGVVQSWSPKSAAHYAQRLVEAGYEYIGLGGLVGHKVIDIYNTVSEVRSRIPESISVHLFGFTQVKQIEAFIGFKITSIDSTSPLLKAFKDDCENYFADAEPHYTALRIPPYIEHSLKRKVQSGLLDVERLHHLERVALQAVKAYGREEADLESTIQALVAYEEYIQPGKDNTEVYRRTLGDRPWMACSCKVCRELGIQALVYRGINRNKRRGFHNLFYFYQRLHQARSNMDRLRVPCIKTQQNAQRHIYSFIVDGKQIPHFAALSRIGRDGEGQLQGYQRPEVQDHIQDIQTYLERDDALLPNSIVVAFQESLHFSPIEEVDAFSTIGTLEISLKGEQKPGWIVDGQQRVAALRGVKKVGMPVSVVAFESSGTAEEREQFMLVNSTKPLPRSLVYELLPSIDGYVPPKMRKRREAYLLLEQLNRRVESPFRGRIRTTTAQHIETANIKDMSVLKMLENSMKDGILMRFAQNTEKALELLVNYWRAVQKRFPEAWDLPPKKSRLTHGVGIVSMGYVMDTIGYKLVRRGRVPDTGAFSKEIKILGRDLPWMDGRWTFSNELTLPWNELQNTARHIDLAANYLIRRYRQASGAEAMVSS